MSDGKYTLNKLDEAVLKHINSYGRVSCMELKQAYGIRKQGMAFIVRKIKAMELGIVFAREGKETIAYTKEEAVRLNAVATKAPRVDVWPLSVEDGEVLRMNTLCDKLWL